MRILMLSNDAKILEKGSAVSARMAWYGSVCDELHIVVPTSNLQLPTSNLQIAENVFAYPAVGSNKIFALIKAYFIGTRILSTIYNLQPTTWVATSQDPFETGFMAWRIARKTGAKLELQIHTDFLSPYFSRESFINKIRVRLAKFLLPKADGIRVVSQRIKNSLQPIYPPKFLQSKNLGGRAHNLQTVPVVLPVFADVQSIREAAPKIDLHKKYPQFDFIVLMVSRLSQEKNIGLAIEAMREVVKEYPKAGLVITGSGPARQALESKVARYKLKENVIFEPWIDDVASYMKTADAFLLTSNYDGLALTLIEAAASGVPIISTDVGIIGGILRDGEEALVCPVGNAACVADRLKRLIKFPDLRRELSLRAESAVESADAISKEEYLNRMREGWEKCLENQ